MGYVFHPKPYALKTAERQDHLWPDDHFDATVRIEYPETSRWGFENVPLFDSHIADIFNYHNDIRFFHGLDDWDFHVYLDKTRRLDFCKRSSFEMSVSTFFGMGFNDMRLAILEVVPFRGHSRLHGYGDGRGFIHPGLHTQQSPWICQYIDHSSQEETRYFDIETGVPHQIEVLGLEGEFPNIWESIVFYRRDMVEGKVRHFVGASERFNLDLFPRQQIDDYVPYINPAEYGGDEMWKGYGSDYQGGYHKIREARTAYLREVELTDSEQEIPIYTLEGQNSGKKLFIKMETAPASQDLVFFVGFKKFHGERRLFWRLTESPGSVLSGVVGNDPHMPQDGDFLAETLSAEFLNDYVFYQNSLRHPFRSYIDGASTSEYLGKYEWNMGRGINLSVLSDYTLNPLSKYLVFGLNGYSSVRVRARHGMATSGLQHVARKVEFYSGDKTSFMFDGGEASSWTGVAHLRGLPSNFRDYFQEGRESLLDLIDQGCLTMAAEDYATTMKATTITSLHEYLDWKFNAGRFWGNISPDEEVPYPDREVSDPFAEEDPQEEGEEEEIGWAEPIESLGNSYEQQTWEHEVGGEAVTSFRIIHGPKDISYDELLPVNVNDTHIRMYFGADCMAFRYLDETIRDIPDNVNLANGMISSVISALDGMMEGKEDVFLAAYFAEPWEGYFSYAKTTWNSGEVQDKIENFWGYQRPGPDPADMYVYWWGNSTPLAHLHDMISVRGLTINDEFIDDIPYSSYNGECYHISVCPLSFTGSGWGTDAGYYGGSYSFTYLNGFGDPVVRAKQGNIKLNILSRYWAGWESACQYYCDETGGQLKSV